MSLKLKKEDFCGFDDVLYFEFLFNHNNAKNLEDKINIEKKYKCLIDFDYCKKHKIINNTCEFCGGDFNENYNLICDCGQNIKKIYAPENYYSDDNLKYKYKEYIPKFGMTYLMAKMIDKKLRNNSIELSCHEYSKCKNYFLLVKNYLKKNNKKNIKSLYVIKKCFLLINRKDAANLFSIKIKYNTFVYYEKIFKSLM